MADVKVDVASGQPKRRTFRKFSFRGVDLDALLDMKNEELVKLFYVRAHRRFQRGLKRKPLALIKKLRKADPRFQPDLSSTYQPVRCNTDCTCDNERVQCVYERQYAEMSSSSRVLGDDIVSFGNESALKPQRAVFGCENSETGDLFSQHADGIMGLGRGQLSIMDQLVDKGLIGDSFSLCYGGMDIGRGTMVLGEISPPPDMVFSASDPSRSPYYNIELKELLVGGEPLRVHSSVFDHKHELSWTVERPMHTYQRKHL